MTEIEDPRPSLLIVDDDEVFCAVLGDALREIGGRLDVLGAP